MSLEIQKQSGFSMVEVLTALGILATVSMIIMGLMDLSNSVAGDAISRGGKFSLEQEIRTVTAKANSCSAALVSTVFNPPTATNPGVTNITMNLPMGTSTLPVTANAVLTAYSLRIEPDGFRFIVPAGAAPETIGTNQVWLGVIELKSSKTKAKAVGGQRMAPSVLTALRIRVDAGGVITGCEPADAYACPDGKVQMGPYSSQCISPDIMFANICPAQRYPVSNGSGVDCMTAAQMIGGLCPVGQVAVSNGAAGVTCRALTGGCFGTCGPDGSSTFDDTIERVLSCANGCWNVTPNTLLCLPRSGYRKGDDEYMNFHQDDSMRRVKGRPCESVQISGREHANLVNGGTGIRFDDTTWGCSNDQNCTAGTAP